MNKYLCDYHVHTTISPDGQHSMYDFCQTAIEKNMDEIVFTDHYEFYKKNHRDYPFNKEYLDQYFSELKECQSIFGEKLVIKAGIELGQPYIDMNHMCRVLQEREFDYVIASLHKIDDIDFSRQIYTKNTIDELCKKYFEELYKLVDRSDYDVVGHFDYIRRYIWKSGEDVDIMKYKNEIIDVLKCIIDKGKGIEINTSAGVLKENETFPVLEIIKLYTNLGGTKLTIGSDAHVITNLRFNFNKLINELKQLGIQSLCTYRKRNLSNMIDI